MPTGNDFINVAIQHLGEDYILGALAPKNNRNWRGPWDCAEFVSWVVYQVTGTLYGCDNNSGSPARADAYTGYWANDLTSGHAIRTSVRAAAGIKGGILLRRPAAGAIGHIVFSMGDGRTVEAKSTREDVKIDTIQGRNWHDGILIPGVTDTTQPRPVTVKKPQAILASGALKQPKAKIRALQTALRDWGIDPGPIDGIYGPQTVAAVVAFQAQNGLVPDGEVGARTALKLGLKWP